MKRDLRRLRSTKHASSLRAALVCASIAITVGAARLHAQDLAPRAYTITPRGSNAFTLANAYNDGPLQLEGASPIEDATARSSLIALAERLVSYDWLHKVQPR